MPGELHQCEDGAEGCLGPDVSLHKPSAFGGSWSCEFLLPRSVNLVFYPCGLDWQVVVVGLAALPPFFLAVGVVLLTLQSAQVLVQEVCRPRICPRPLSGLWNISMA